MEKKRKIVQYRERLDRTLASPDLTNDEMLKRLVESQLMCSSNVEVEGYKEKVVEMKTAEVSNFLDMLRSASSDDSGRSNTSHSDWKLKQDNEEFRVMYREGPEGTPFHTLLVEGFVDGPIDVCLCISWETYLYKKWWPQSTVPMFKILSSECLHKVQITEQISLVRVKVSWPLSMREAVVHYYLFEYFQDDLIVVLTNSVPESNCVYGILNEAIPKAKDVVRVDLVGGFALQKVTSERSYFRTIANMDIKLDFVPPSLINFVSRQLIGNGFRLYKKVVTSMISHEEQEVSKALGDPLYVRIREALYSNNGSKANKDGEELKQVAKIFAAKDPIERKQDEAKDISQDDKSNQYADNAMLMAMNRIVQDNSKTLCEIVEVDNEDIIEIQKDDEEVNDILNKEIKKSAPNGSKSAPNGSKSVCISSEVEQALKTLDKAISIVREHKSRSPFLASSSFPEEESLHMTNGVINLSLQNEVASEVSNSDTPEGTSQDAPDTNSDIKNFRYAEPNSNLNEVNSNKVAPTSTKQNHLKPIEAIQVSLENRELMDQTSCSNKELNTGSVQDVSSGEPNKFSKKKVNTIVPQGSSDLPKKSPPRGRRRYLYCCFLH